MALVTVQRSPSPSGSAEEDEQDGLDTTDSNVKSPRQRRRRSKSALKKLRKLFNTVRFVTKLKPCFSESYFTVKGAALILPQSDDNVHTRKANKSHTGDEIQLHLQAMISLLRPQDTIKVAVKLEGTHTRYLAVVSCMGRQDTEECVILGIDLLEKASIGLILPVYAHIHIQLDGDGGFTIQSDSNIHIFKPVSVQAMWSALQSLNKVVKLAKDKLYIPRGLTHTWVGYYDAKLTTETVLLSEWNATKDIDDSYNKPDRNKTSGKLVRRTQSTPVGRTFTETFQREEDIYKRIRLELKNVMMTVDLEEVTCLFLRKSIQDKLGMDLENYKSFIDTEMLEILGQMDSPSKILDYLYLGSEWNASNLEELQINGVQYILNISREIDNFYPGILHYMNVREWDVDVSDLLKHWEDTHKFINKARKRGCKALVHCKMGISRSASTVIAYLMKEMKWQLQQAYEYTKSKRSIINPNQGFWRQLEMYEGILMANWNREFFNRHAPPKPLPPTDETDEPGDGLETFHSAEELLAVNLGKDNGKASEAFGHMEQDIELASRSADSTEESLPDQLSPETIQRPKHRKSEREKTESGDYISSDSEDSKYTTGSELSDDEDESGDDLMVNIDSREGKVFVPVDLPSVELEVSEEMKRPIKVEGRRCKSESDKNLLAVDETLIPCSREGSVSKFKADASWIKPASESEMSDNNNSNCDGAGMEETVNDSMNPDDGGGLWMGNKPDEEQSLNIESSVGKPKAAESIQNKSSDNQSFATLSSKITEPYVRENIPWNPGMVKKQKQDIEIKYGTPCVIKRESQEGSEETMSQQQQTTQGIDESVAREPVIVKPKPVNSLVTPDFCDQSQDSRMLDVNQSAETSQVSDQSVTIEVSRGSESPKTTGETRMSVYEAEAIDLPEGIVRKTTLEIEERSRSSLDIPNITLRRSSSLKSTRVTPKAKDRNSERRKTCIALLSPTHPDYTERESSGYFTLRDLEARSPGTGSDQGGEKPVFELDSDDSDVEMRSRTSSGSIKIYKFMGEELTVQEGMVRKQTLDIENKAYEPPGKRAAVSDSVSYAQERCSKSSEPSTSVKQTLTSTEQKITDKSDKDKTSSAFRTDIPLCSCPSDQTDRRNSSESAFQKISDNFSNKNQSSASSSVTPVKKKLPPESRFDPETLELIREIGSALLNSPAKSELEDSLSEDIKEGESLVSHYVRKIERISGVKKRKQKEIVIIDKSNTCNEGQKSKSSSCSGKSSNTQSDTTTVTVAKKQILTPQTSKDNPVSHQPDGATPRWSPVPKKEISVPGKQSPEVTAKDTSPSASKDSHLEKSELNLQLKSALTADEKSDQSKLNGLDVDTEKCSVKKLLGKFQQPEQVSGKLIPVFSLQSIQSPTSNTPITPGAKAELSQTVFAQKTPIVSGTVNTFSEIAGQGQSMSRSKDKQEEPPIQLCENSVKLFQTKLMEMGTSLFDRSTSLPEESETDYFDLEIGKGESQKPKSASYGPAAGRRVALTQAKASPGGEGQQPFSWNGKKVRKSYGKTHPLAKLEGRQYGESARNSPFYNTM